MLMKKTNALVVSALLLIMPVFSAFAARKAVVRTGIEVLEERGFAGLVGKRIRAALTETCAPLSTSYMKRRAWNW